MKKNLIYLFLIFILLAIPSVQILTRSVNIFGLFSWLSSIGMVIKVFWSKKERSPLFNLDKKDYILFTVFVILQTSIFVVLNFNSEHYHRDEFIVAYASMDLPSISKINWFEGFPKNWVVQFPILFYILQKSYLMIFGTSLFSIRLSILPYNIFILFYVYLFAKHLVHRKFATITAVIYIFLACNIFMTTMSTLTIASALCIIATLYHFSFIHEKSNQHHSTLTGVFMALSFLNYTGSYVTLPVVILGCLYQLLTNRTEKIIRNIKTIFTVFLVILLPFILHNIFIYPYFFERYNTVNFIQGERSTFQTELNQGVPAFIPLLIQLSNSFFALSTPNIGGTDGYYFGNQALFDPFTYILFAAGIWSLVYYFQKNKSPIYLYILVTLIISFIVGYVLTIQPPAFHRLSVLFPLFALVISLGLYTLTKSLTYPNKLTSNVIFFVGVSVYVLLNANHLRQMLVADPQDYPYSTSVAEKIQQVVPIHSTIYIAAYPSFHLGQELAFRTNNLYSYLSENKEQILSTYSGEPMLIMNPIDEELESIKEAYPDYIYQYYENSIGESIGFFYPPRINYENAIITP